MALARGTRLGPYEILNLAGRGGMGEVYVARDTRLGRRVAIKIARGALLGDADAQRRFDEEIRLAAMLDHPRICAVHDVGQSDDIRYFVMEFLEGESLAARLARGPLPLPELLEHAVQIAAALAYAHKNRVLHRDVKPGNVFLTPSGVKVLDFGLAKLPGQFTGDAASDMANLATQPIPLTRPGLLLGTPEYFAPERLKGGEGDHRSDIFAFGALLYEMATGRHAFDGPTPAAIISEILSSEPPPMVGHGSATPELEWVVRRCVKKDPAARWESMSDVEAVLRWLMSGVRTPQSGVETIPDDDEKRSGSGPKARTKFRGRFRPTRVAAAVAVGLVCVALGALARGWWSPPQAESSAPVVRFTLPIEPVPTTDFGPYSGSRLALSRDGRRLAYVSRRPDRTPSIYVRQLGSPVTTLVDRTEGAWGVFFSPDGGQLGFFAGGKLKRLSVEGGTVLTICDAPQGAGGAWGDDNTIVFAPSPMSVLMRVSAGGGTPTPVTSFRNGEVSHRFPQFLPGGAVLYAAAASDNFTSAKIVAESLRTGSRMELFDGTYPRYVGSGHLVFARENSLFTVPFDPIGLRPVGTPQSLVTNLRMSQETGAGLFDVTETALVYRAAGAPVIPRLLVWVDMEGREEIVPLEPVASLSQPRLSPDGARVAVAVGEPAWNRDLWIYDFLHKAFTRFTVETGEEETPVWSPDSRRIAFSTSGRGSGRTILVRGADGDGSPTSVGSGQHIHVSDWSPNGRDLVWTEFKPTPGGEIRTATLDRSGVMRTLAAGPFDARGGVFSPDGRWIAFTSNESGQDEVYVQSYPGSARKHRISVERSREPVWSRRGDQLYFRGRGRMWAVDVQTSPTFSAGEPRVLFADAYEVEHGGGGDRNYDLSADGRRFLMVKPARPYPPAEVIVTLNWRTGPGDRK